MSQTLDSYTEKPTTVFEGRTISSTPRPNPSIEWFAAFFDGEGNITITIRQRQFESRSRGLKFRRLRVSGPVRYNHNIHCCVTNTFFPVIDAFHREFGGCLHKVKNYSSRQRPTWVVQLGANAARRFLNAVFPYLIIKKEQARLALEFLTLRTPNCRGKTVAPENWAKREDLRLRMHLLNRPNSKITQRLEPPKLAPIAQLRVGLHKSLYRMTVPSATKRGSVKDRRDASLWLIHHCNNHTRQVMAGQYEYRAFKTQIES